MRQIRLRSDRHQGNARASTSHRHVRVVRVAAQARGLLPPRSGRWWPRRVLRRLGRSGAVLCDLEVIHVQKLNVRGDGGCAAPSRPLGPSSPHGLPPDLHLVVPGGALTRPLALSCPLHVALFGGGLGGGDWRRARCAGRGPAGARVARRIAPSSRASGHQEVTVKGGVVGVFDRDRAEFLKAGEGSRRVRYLCRRRPLLCCGLPYPRIVSCRRC